MSSIVALVALALAGVVALTGLVYLCRQVATRHQRDDPTIRGIAAAVILFGALVALGNIVFVFAGTVSGADGDTYSGRQVLYLELSLTGSYTLVAGLGFAGLRLIRRKE